MPQRENPASKITPYNACSLACHAYSSALSVVNIRSAFKRTGIYPFNPDAISDLQQAPSKAFLPPQANFSEHVPENSTTSAPQPAQFLAIAEKVIADKQRFENKQKQNNQQHCFWKVHYFSKRAKANKYTKNGFFLEEF